MNKTEEKTTSGNRRLANWRFSAPLTHLCFFKVLFSASTFAVKTPPSKTLRGKFKREIMFTS